MRRTWKNRHESKDQQNSPRHEQGPVSWQPSRQSAIVIEIQHFQVYEKAVCRCQGPDIPDEVLLRGALREFAASNVV